MSKLNIDKLLKQHGRTQKELAESTGINKNTVSKYCNDTFENINKTHIDLLCKFFNCTPNDLFEIDNTVTINEIENFSNKDNYNKIKELVNTTKFLKNFYIDDNKEYEDYIKSTGISMSNINKNCPIDPEFKVDNDINIEVPSLEYQNELKQIFEQKIEKEISKQFNEKYNNYINDYIQKYLYEYLIILLCDYSKNNDDKDKYKKFFEKYKNFKSNKSTNTDTFSNTDYDSYKHWADFLENFSTNSKVDIDKFESCMNTNKKDYSKKD